MADDIANAARQALRFWRGIRQILWRFSNLAGGRADSQIIVFRLREIKLLSTSACLFSAIPAQRTKPTFRRRTRRVSLAE